MDGGSNLGQEKAGNVSSSKEELEERFATS